MPELPEVETVRRGLAPTLVGAAIIAAHQRARPDLRFPLPERFVERLTRPARRASCARRAKYLLADLDRGETLIMHLGMSGLVPRSTDGEPTPASSITRVGKAADARPCRVRVSRAARASPTTIRAASASWTARADGKLARPPLFAGIGVEPLADDFDGAALATSVRRPQARR